MHRTTMLVIAISLPLAWLLAGCRAEGDGSGKPNVILVLADALRADHLGAYGAARPDVSPRFDAWSSRAALFEQAVSVSNWTIPSVASIFTGVYPTVHGVRKSEAGGVVEMSAFDARLDTVAEVFRDQGYATAALLKSFILEPELGYGLGFDDYTFVHGRYGNSGESGRELTDAAIEWIDAHRGRPFFLYLHYTDPHDAYLAPPPHRGRYLPKDYTGGLTGTVGDMQALVTGRIPDEAAHRDFLDAAYAEEVQYWDVQFGRLLDHLAATGLAERTLVAVTADHGEMFFDHGFWLHRNLYQENVHVPFVIGGPGVEPGRRAGWIENFDVSPTLLELVGIAPPAGWQATSWAAVARGEGEIPDEAVFSHHRRFDAVIRGRYKLLIHTAPHRPGHKWCRTHPTGDPQLFDLAVDPTERHDVAAAHPDVVQRLNALIVAQTADNVRLAAGLTTETRQIDPDTRARLESLGYVGD